MLRNKLSIKATSYSIMFAIMVCISMYSQRFVQFRVKNISKLPIHSSGRVQPLSSVAKNLLLSISGQFNINLISKQVLTSDYFITEVVCRPEITDTLPVFMINNKQVLSMFGRDSNKQNRYSFNELQLYFDQINNQVQHMKVKNNKRVSKLENSLTKLHNDLTSYHNFVHVVRHIAIPHLNHIGVCSNWQLNIYSSVSYFNIRKIVNIASEEQLGSFILQTEQYLSLSENSSIRIMPSDNMETSSNCWNNIGCVMVDLIYIKQFPAILNLYTQMIVDYINNQIYSYNSIVWFLKKEYMYCIDSFRVDIESFFNRMEIFNQNIILYYLASCLIIINWIFSGNIFDSTASAIVNFSFFLHTLGLFSRAYIQSRPPVTNLYSSAIFIGWMIVSMCMVVNKWVFRKIEIDLTGAIAGVFTLILAHQLSMTGSDNIEMVRAVLDSNFWLIIHVLTITIGYVAMFLSGILGSIYIIQGLFTNKLDEKKADSLITIINRILYFALLFSFVGTVLGGIWADKSWGRFWGWDPKENGALLIILWLSVVLHSTINGSIKRRGLVVSTIIGNLITSWSWIGVNMLGVGLHSYGFTDQSLKIFLLFTISQILIIVLGLLPNRLWKSYGDHMDK